MTLTFAFYVILIGKRRRFNPTWFDVFATYSKKCFQEPWKLSGAMTARRGSVFIDYRRF